jgi:2-polyprenyl-3-methyl-5-hydroxy-6-metoxy-1,4-benzoquinol methylase
MNAIVATPEANYDVVGQYEQDQINGFSPETINLMLSLSQLHSATTVLDCMAGDGNLSERLASFCSEHAIQTPESLLLEYSRVQVEFARARLAHVNTRCIWGDILEFVDRETGNTLPAMMCDRLLVKSANHEIPLDKQQLLADNLLRLLHPDGLLINLGFLLDDRRQRDELAAFTKVKDRLAGMEMQVKNRYFLLQDEYYQFLEKAGFEVIGQQPIVYRIDSTVVAEQYFPEERLHEAHVEFQAAQLSATHMRNAGRLHFTKSGSVMELPGEITVARRLPEKTRTKKVYSAYPYELVRSMRCHTELRAQVVSMIAADANVLDLGCGPGFLAEALSNHTGSYTGIDMSQDFVTYARKHAGIGQLFIPGDVNERMNMESAFDAVCLLNVLYQEAVNVHAVLSHAYSYLRPGGYLFVAGPLRKESFTSIQDSIHADLLADEVPFEAHQFEAVVAANERLLRAGGNYWSAEGMVALLNQFGFTESVLVSTDVYYGNSYLVVVRKPSNSRSGNC